VLAPRGWPLQGLGVMPQVCTSLGQAATDRQLADLAAGRDAMADALARSRAARAPLQAGQIIDIRDACPAAEGRREDLRVTQALIGNPTAYAAALLPPAGP
jgi:carboxyl-terminal processing protease